MIKFHRLFFRKIQSYGSKFLFLILNYYNLKLNFSEASLETTREIDPSWGPFRR